MKEIDFTALDGRLLRIFVAVMRTGSVTLAAEELHITQSTASHALDRLRSILRDPLFVRSGRRIVPTTRAQRIEQKALQLLEDMHALTEPETFDPATATGRITISANDYEREMILTDVFREFRSQAPGLLLHIRDTGGQFEEDLRTRRTDLVLTPTPPAGAGELMTQKLMSDRMVSFYDPVVRTAPRDLQAYIDAPHALVSFADAEPSRTDQALARLGHRRNIVYLAPSFDGLPNFVRGTDILASLPAMLGGTLMRDFAEHPLPFPTPDIEFRQIWHARDQHNPQHQWLRRLVHGIAEKLTSAQAGTG